MNPLSIERLKVRGKKTQQSLHKNSITTHKKRTKFEPFFLKICVSFQVFPPVSNLDPSIYGPQDSALKEEQIIGHLNGLSVQQVWQNEASLYLFD